MAIKEFISLEGAEQVQKSLKDVSATGEAALKQLRDAACRSSR